MFRYKCAIIMFGYMHGKIVFLTQTKYKIGQNHSQNYPTIWVGGVGYKFKVEDKYEEITF